MARSSEHALGFIKSVGLLTIVGLVALWVFFPRSDEVVPLTDNLVEDLQLSKRESLRRAALIASANRPQPEDYNFGKIKPVKTAATPKPLAPVLKPQSSGPLGMGSPDAIDPDVQAAIDSIDNGDIQTAVSQLEAILAKNPKNEQALVEMAMIQLLDLKQTAAAIGYLEKVVDVNPANRIVMNELVSLYEEEGRLDEGLARMQSAAEAHPDSGEIAYGVGQMLSLQGRDEDAIPHLEKASLNDGNNFRAQKELAEAYARVGQPEKSIDAYQQTLGKQQKDLQNRTEQGLPTTFARERLGYTKLDLARELINSGRFEEAQQEIDFAREAVPDTSAIDAAQRRLDAKRG